MNLSQLYIQFKSFPAYLNLALNSKSLYDQMIGTAVEYFKDKNVLTITTLDADKYYYETKISHGLHRASMSCKILRRVWNISIRYQLLKHNPFLKMGLETPPSRTDRWAPYQVEAFYQSSLALNLAPVGTIIYVCYDMVQRPGDVRSLKWDNYREETVNNEITGYLDFIQQKTKKRIHTPVTELVRLLINSQPIVNEFIINRVDIPEPYRSTRLFAEHVQRIKKHAKVPAYLQVRDLRRSGMTEMRENGADDKLIRTLSGHNGYGEFPTYVIDSLETAKQAINYRHKEKENDRNIS